VDRIVNDLVSTVYRLMRPTVTVFNFTYFMDTGNMCSFCVDWIVQNGGPASVVFNLELVGDN